MIPERDLGAGRKPLAGTRVLVTRPAGQCAGLAAVIEARGGEAVVMPLIEIGPPRDPAPALAALAALEDFDVVVFTSRNAVEHAFALAPRSAAKLAGRLVAALGEASAAALRAAGVDGVVVPRAGNDSEALLAMPALGEDAVRGRTVLVVKGEGGRELLGRTLGARGARVVLADVYRRRRPAASALAPLANARADAIVVTSAESLDNLLALADARCRSILADLAFVAISERVAERIRAAGVGAAVVVAERAGDGALADALVACRRAAPRHGGARAR